MRALLTFAGGRGHAEPLVPIAAALRAAGHEVAFAGRSDVAAGLRARGFAAFDEPRDTTGTPTAQSSLRAPDMAHELRVLREAYAGRIAHARAASVAAACRAWMPGVVVCDELDFGAMVAAERLGLPHATVLVTAAGSFVRPDVVAAPLAALRAEHGLPPDPRNDMPHRHLVLAPLPPSLRDPAFPLPPRARSLRPGPLAPPGPASAPRWLITPRRERPLVYLTLGTVFNMESGDLLARALAGLRRLAADVVVTVGPGRDPDGLGPQPAHVRVERDLPHALLMPRCALVVSHGGSGTLVDALSAGVPSLLLPLGADQPLNAARCEALGAGLVLDPVAADPATIAEAAGRVLGEPRFAAAAARVRAASAALPGPEAAVAPLETLAASSAAEGR